MSKHKQTEVVTNESGDVVHMEGSVEIDPNHTFSGDLYQ